MLKEKLDDLKSHNFKAKAAEQREKINKLKDTDELIAEAEAAVSEYSAPVMEKALSEVPSKKASAAAKKSKPAWATTEKQAEENKEAEIDDLLEFAYELDYEKYMEDFDVRQALAVIKERVAKIKEEPDWKQ
jgi:spore coat polysaccharide biosynthesis predicted glycosyltransferase SpsG